MAKQRMYSPQTIAKLSGCTVQTIYRHLEGDRFPNARRIGLRKWFIPEEDVIAYVGFDPADFEDVEFVQ